ncbi:diaminobutyrate--2-oxoglutarate transaminase family protein [Actinophytocola xinjiangensis]|nr:diaminobutyrate--2-oxoglutarate transaminase family protein [Actinophytocola xinjiangensis]
MNPRGPMVRTAIPGPRGAALLASQSQRESNARAYPRNLPIAVARARGCFVEDVDGNVFVDFLSGAGVVSLGHSHPELVATAKAQLDEFVHGLDLPTEAKDEFVSAQLRMLPAGMRDHMRIQFCGPTGANAVDAAIKLCKTATGRGDVVVFSGAFHGSSTAALSMTGWVGQKERIANPMPGVHFFPYSYCARCPLSLDPDTCATNCVAVLENQLRDTHGGIATPAAVVLELVQGEGGVIPARPEFVTRIRELTRELDIPLVVDEVQTGCGRTGDWFAFERYGIEPDVVVASKALSGVGLPAAVIIYDERLDVWAPGAHSGTFRGNQLAFATGVEAIRIIERDGVLDDVRARGEQVRRRLSGLPARHRHVFDVRGTGLMWGIELADPRTGEPRGDLAREAQRRCLDRGLILETGGRAGAVLRLLPPLVVTEDVLDTALDIVEDALAAVTPDPTVKARIPLETTESVSAPPAAGPLLARAARMPSLRAKYGPATEWADVPVLSKDELNTAIEELLSGEPDGRGGAYVYASGGTISEPRLSLIPGDMFVPDILAHWQPLDPHDVVVNLFTPGRLWSAHYFYNAVAAASGAAVVPFGGLADDELDSWIDFFQAQGCTALAATPTTLKRLLLHLGHSGRTWPALRKLLWVGEKFDDATSALVAKHLPEAEVWGLYGSTETWVIGWNTPLCRPDTVHPLPYQYVELRDGAILITNTHERCVNPLLRYQVGDVGEFVDCPCGRPAAALRVLGRVDSYFKFLNQLISPEELVGLACGIDDVLDAQLALLAPGTTAERLVLNVRSTSDSRPGLPDRVRSHVLAGHLGLGYVVSDAPAAFEVGVVDELASNDRTAKTPLLVITR